MPPACRKTIAPATGHPAHSARPRDDAMCFRHAHRVGPRRSRCSTRPMFPRLSPLALAMPLLSLFGCFRTSAELPTTLADLRVEISIEHLVERQTNAAPYARKSIKAELRNARGRAIEREDVRLEVNGIPLEFHVARGNYYDRH